MELPPHMRTRLLLIQEVRRRTGISHYRGTFQSGLSPVTLARFILLMSVLVSWTFSYSTVSNRSTNFPTLLSQTGPLPCRRTNNSTARSGLVTERTLVYWVSPRVDTSTVPGPFRQTHSTDSFTLTGRNYDIQWCVSLQYPLNLFGRKFRWTLGVTSRWVDTWSPPRET